MILELLQQLRTKQWIGFFCVVSTAKRNWRRLFIVIWAEAVCRLRGQTATNLRWSRYRSNYIITKVIIPDRLKTSELVVKLQINLVTNRGTDLYHMVYWETIPQMTGKGWGKTNSCLTLGKVTEGLRQLAGREKIPVIPTHEVKVLQLFVCYTPTRRGVIKITPGNLQLRHWPFGILG